MEHVSRIGAGASDAHLQDPKGDHDADAFSGG